MIVIEAKVSWSMVYYSSDFLAIWIWHLQNSKMSKSTLFLVQNCEGCLVSCITWWYMIPNARRKFEAFLKFPEGFGHWGRSILVNGILYFRLFGHLEMTSSKYQNVKINFDSGSNLRRALGNMYHHVIHDSKRSAQVWWLMEDFPGVLSHPGRHTGPRKKNTFFYSKTGKTHIAPKINSKQLLWRLFYSQKIPFAYKSRFGGFPENLLRGCS